MSDLSTLTDKALEVTDSMTDCNLQTNSQASDNRKKSSKVHDVEPEEGGESGATTSLEKDDTSMNQFLAPSRDGVPTDNPSQPWDPGNSWKSREGST